MAGNWRRDRWQIVAKVTTAVPILYLLKRQRALKTLVKFDIVNAAEGFPRPFLGDAVCLSRPICRDLLQRRKLPPDSTGENIQQSRCHLI